MSFGTTVIVDADHNAGGWEIVFRFGPEDLIVAYSDLSDDALRTTIDPQVADALIALRAERTG